MAERLYGDDEMLELDAIAAGTHPKQRKLDAARLDESKRQAAEALAQVRATLARVDGLLVEMRVQKERTADDVFSEIGPWEGESKEELIAMLSEAREGGTSGKVPEL